MNAPTIVRQFRTGLFFALTLISCSGGAAGGAPAAFALQQRLEEISRAAQGHVGVAAQLLETGETVTLNAHDRFPMQSVYKMLIGMAVLHQVDEGVLRLDQVVSVGTNDFVPPLTYSFIRDEHPSGIDLSVRALLEAMVSGSDGTASDVLLRLAGGPKPVQAYLAGLGVTNVAVATTEAEMGRDELAQYRNWACPDALVMALRALYEGRGLSVTNRALLLDFMIRTTTGPGRIKGLLPPGTMVAHKTGTSRTFNGLTRTTNDVGLITLPGGKHLAIAVLVSDSTADTAVREEVIAKITRAAWDFWTKQ